MARSLSCCRTGPMTQAAALAAAAFLTACGASVPRESVELSVMVGERIVDMQVSHEAFVQDYFRLSRERVEDFLSNRWVPQYLENFVRGADLMAILQTPEPLPEDDVRRIQEELSRNLRLSTDQRQEVVAAVQSALGDAKRGALIIEAAEAATESIRRQRAEIIDPINAQEAHVLKELRAAYTELRAMQDVITNHLQSVQEVQVAQEAILQRLQLLEARDKAIQSAVEFNDRIVGLLGAAGDAEKTVEAIQQAVQQRN